MRVLGYSAAAYYTRAAATRTESVIGPTIQQTLNQRLCCSIECCASLAWPAAEGGASRSIPAESAYDARPGGVLRRLC
jgi:hypothetical protein